MAKRKDRQDEWRAQVKQTLEAEEPGDLDRFAILWRAKRVALICARDILGILITDIVSNTGSTAINPLRGAFLNGGKDN